MHVAFILIYLKKTKACLIKHISYDIFLPCLSISLQYFLGALPIYRNNAAKHGITVWSQIEFWSSYFVETTVMQNRFKGNILMLWDNVWDVYSKMNGRNCESNIQLFWGSFWGILYLEHDKHFAFLNNEEGRTSGTIMPLWEHLKCFSRNYICWAAVSVCLQL